MPAEYMKCMETEMKDGKSKKDAQKVCAISYYKRHGRTPMQDEHMDAALAAMFEEITAAKKKKHDPEKKEEHAK